MRTGILAVVLIACSADDSVAERGTLGPNDVSILFPLPAQVGSGLLLGGTGDTPPFLGATMFSGLGGFDDDYESWVAVAARIDPCFPGPSECRPQVRIVAQPVVEEGGIVGANDSAVHLLFDLDGQDFERVRENWLALPRTDASALLGVHPLLVEEGWSGEFGTAFLALLEDVVTSGSLDQIAAMSGNSLSWTFRSFTVSGAPSPASIALLDQNEQFYTTLLPQDSFSIQPASSVDLELEALSGSPAGEVGGPWELTASSAEVTAALELTIRLDDPASEFSPESVDCVACHLATRLRERALDSGFDLPGDLTAGAPLAIATPLRGSGQMVRAFGYFGVEPVITQRTVNESILVAREL